jgi:GAF domain-containing protein
LYITAQAWRLSSLYLGVLGLVTLTTVRKLFSDTTQAILQETGLIAELEKERQQSEERITSRAQALQTSTEISHSISNLLDPNDLIKVVLEQIRTGFGYYHVQLYHLDNTGGYLHLVGSTGEKGEVLMARKHKIAIGRGIVGQTALTNQPTVAPDVSKVDAWLPNPELPDTQAELAVPFGSGDQIQGVLDVQQNRPNSLGQDDVYVLQVIADQLAVALQNAQQYAQIQQRTQREQLLNSIQTQIQMAQTPEEVLRTAAQNLGQALNLPRVHIRLGDLAAEK